MPGLVPGIHDLLLCMEKKDVDGRDKPGYDKAHYLSFIKSNSSFPICLRASA